MDFLAEGSPTAVIDSAAKGDLVGRLLDKLATARGPLRRVLLIPPDISRFHSAAGELTSLLFERLHRTAQVEVLPAIGTHRPMSAAEIAEMFPGVPADRFHVHDWRNAVVPLGEVPASFVRELSEGQLDFSIRVEVNRLLVEGKWDAIISVGQLVPHEVIGIANHSKNVFIGVGGSDLINRSHYLGAVYGMERYMGRAQTPVRAVLDYASENFAKHLPITYLLTVRSRAEAGALVTRGLFAGDDASCFRRGAELCRTVNLDRLDRAPKKMIVFLDPKEFKSTWLGNKAIYRTRMAMADGGELIILAPGVKEFGEQPEIDRLIREFGYRGTDFVLDAVRRKTELADHLAAAAHLIHSSSEGRFKITYCPGKLSRAEIESVGYSYSDLGETMRHNDPAKLKNGWNVVNGEEIYYIPNPALGLWGTAARFGDAGN